MSTGWAAQSPGSSIGSLEACEREVSMTEASSSWSEKYSNGK